MAINKQLIVALALSGLIGVAHADEKEELLKLRNTTVNLIKQLVKQGVLTDKTANEMIKQAEADAGKQAAAAKVAGGKNAVDAGNVEQAAVNGAVAKDAVPADEVRVTYVPDFVKDEIRQQVRSELREEVVGDVMQKAKDEKWGTAEGVPEWVKRFKLSGDLRLRDQGNFYASDNIAKSYFNWQTINTLNNGAGNGIGPAGINAFQNTTLNRNVSRERFRLGIDADIAKGVDAGIRLATGNTPNPVSTNQTLGNTGALYQFAVDRAFLRYNGYDDKKFNWLTAMAGRTPNPFFTAGSEVVWDEDLSFEGAALTIRHRLGVDQLSDEIGGKGPTVFATGGLFPLQSTNLVSGLSARDKWFFGGQIGVDWGFDNQDSLQMGGAYYDYQNIKAVINKSANPLCNTNTADMNQSVPQFMQGGNSLVSICNGNTDLASGGLVGLASDYRIVDINALYDMALFSPIHLRFSADVAKNIGFNRSQILAYTGYHIAEKTTAWQFKVDLGWTKMTAPGNWNIFTGYKYVERDAVLDAYTDSDFHNGGTNVKGWMMGGNYALMKSVWLTGRWLSGNVINGPAYGLDVMQLDLNTRF
ncbi:putative porin [Methylomonas sp. AM2-LC]|uniref:putative porin n=1 Tax=Methylomonas sp. AM2-LC TaxID=3153301 RepID=UPI003265CCC5